MLLCLGFVVKTHFSISMLQYIYISYYISNQFDKLAKFAYDKMNQIQHNKILVLMGGRHMRMEHM